LIALYNLIRYVISAVGRLAIRLVYRLVCAFVKLQPGSVLLVCTRDNVLGDNLLQIRDHLEAQSFHCREVFFDTSRPLWRHPLAGVRFLTQMAQTEYTLLDDYFPLVYPIRLRPGARLVQVWHALGAFKRVGYSRAGKEGGPTSRTISHRNYTDVIVSADSIRQDYAEAFGVTLDKVHATGIPRTDLFFDDSAQQRTREQVLQTLPGLRDKRVILFAPTFRGNGKRTAHYPPDFLDLPRLGDALSDNDVFAIKMHPFVTQRLTIPADYADRIVDVSSYPEFNHLLLVSDLLITDYSSAIFDYAFLHRPIVFYVPDIDDYDESRGFYYPFDDYAYGPVATSFDALLALLNTTSVDQVRHQAFETMFLNRCDGAATQRFIDTVMTSHLPSG